MKCRKTFKLEWLRDDILGVGSSGGSGVADEDAGEADVDEGRREATRWNGWGYLDTEFQVDDEGVVRLTGSRYDELFQGSERAFPYFLEWCEDVLGIDVDNKEKPLDKPGVEDYPESQAPVEFMKALESYGIDTDVSVGGRLKRSHGHTCSEAYALRFVSPVPWKIPDVVVNVESHQAVEKVVALAGEFNALVVPFGGGTNVTQVLNLTAEEPANKQFVVCVDMRRMNKIRWIDRSNMCACIEAGAIGKDIEQKLNKLGLTMGHEPDSIEFSSIGGWVATKSSGMKKNVYGNMEDILLDVKVVTSNDVTTLGGGERKIERVSIGPDATRLILGSEGMLGVITEVTVRLRLKPQIQRYESYVFADFRQGCGAMREIALQRVAPASVRLMDNTQFKMGQALKPPIPDKGTPERWKHDILDNAKRYYVTKYHGFDPDKLCAMVLLFEGSDKQNIATAESAVRKICMKYGAIRGGAESGIRGYFLTFMIAYLRDFGLNYGFLSESFETSVRWTDVNLVYERVKDRIRREAAKEGVQVEPLVGGRVTQTYDTCAVIYFYYGILKDGLADPVATFSKIEHAARDEIIKLGGSLSHHHGVGKLREPFYARVTSSSERGILGAVKRAFDPRNTFLSHLPFDSKL